MKKLIYTIVLAAGFQFAYGQQVLLTTYKAGNNNYKLDSATVNVTGAPNPFSFAISFYIYNNGTQSINVGDTVFFKLTFNDDPSINPYFVATKEIEVDSVLALTGNTPGISHGAIRNGERSNSLCIEVTRIVYGGVGGVSTPISKPPYCSYFDFFGITTGIMASVFDAAKIYPNPVRDNLKIENLQDATDIRIYNVMGQEVKTVSSAMGSAEIDMSGLSNGLYFVKMQNGKSIRTEKIQVVK